MPSPSKWWRRVEAAVKDQRSLCLVRLTGGRQQRRHADGDGAGHRIPEVEAAIIRATSHDERKVDYKSAGCVFAWARAAPSTFLAPLMWSLARRASRTRCWVVALKSLLLAHGLLLCSDDAHPSARLGRLPFDLSDFLDRTASSSPSSLAVSAFVRAYFRFLDHRALFTTLHPVKAPAAVSNVDAELERLDHLQVLLDLLMQIRPYGDGMEFRLVLEAMDCAVIEIFEVYSSICSGIAHFLVGILGDNKRNSSAKSTTTATPRDDGGEAAARSRERGALAVRILRRSTAQSAQLSTYFEVCRALGVLNAAEFPPVERIPEGDIDDLEAVLLGGIPEIVGGDDGGEVEKEKKKEEKKKEKEKGHRADQEEGDKSTTSQGTTVITKEWVVFEEEEEKEKEKERLRNFGNPFLCSPEESPAATSWAAMVNGGRRAVIPVGFNGNLIDLI